MTGFWEELATRRAGIYTVEDFEAAAYRLVSEQVLYYSDRTSKVSYSLVDSFESNFNRALEPLGISIVVNRQLRYAVALPRHAKISTATKSQTLFALTLRGIYEEGVRAGDITEEGEVVCDFVGLQEKYRLMTGRDLPARGELDTLIRTSKRWGIARRLDDDAGTDHSPLHEQSAGGVAVRPGILDVLGQTALIRLAQWSASAGDGVVQGDSGKEETLVGGDSNEAS